MRFTLNDPETGSNVTEAELKFNWEIRLGGKSSEDRTGNEKSK
jgi:hypothetical protein